MAENLCNLELLPVSNNNLNCDPATGKPIPGVGQQVVAFFYQDPAGDMPDLSTLAGMQAASTADGVDRVYGIKNLSNGLVPAATPRVQEGQQVAYGVRSLQGMARTATGDVQYFSKADQLAIDKLNRRTDTLRTWFLDNNNYLHGPIESASLKAETGLQLPGIGDKPAYYAMVMGWDDISEPEISDAPAPHLKNFVNTAPATTPA